MKSGFKAISDYGIIGNTRTAALINREGGIDWCCAPNFDSPPCFYPMLDLKYGGYCLLESAGLRPQGRRYVGESAVLENTFRCSGGRFTTTDFMPVIEDGFAGPETGLVQIARVVRCLEGECSIRMRVSPAKGFVHRHHGSDPHAYRNKSRYELSDRELMLEADGCRISVRKRETLISRRLQSGEYFAVLMTFSQPPDLTRHGVEDVLWLEQRTIAYWKEWSQQIRYDGDYHDAVVRSAITLKLCQFSSTGAIVAAPTTSLPEKIGSQFNWDYRFSWLRDSTFTLVALLSLELGDEAFRFFKFLHAANQKLQGFPTLFTIFGEHPLSELDLKHLSGYRNSKPVRVGNAAADQLQLDIFGELMHCIHLLLSHTQLDSTRFSFDGDLWPMIQDAVDTVCRKWKLPDKGIWETRHHARRFVYSQGMCWIALERGIDMAERHGKKVPAHWRRALEALKKEFHARSFSVTKRSYLQAYGYDDLDASVLRLTLLGLLHPHDHRVGNTIAAIGRELMPNGFVLRNKNLDGGAAGEGAFLPCSFWYADNLVLSGKLQEGRKMFERLLQCGNDLGLFSEEYNPPKNGKGGFMLGNFPQAFTHVALINSAVQLAISAKGHVSESHEIVRGRNHKGMLAS
ncbi:MAG: glycoside hydrolase family 15 protein [Acidobacteriaceae bacterium]